MHRRISGRLSSRPGCATVGTPLGCSTQCASLGVGESNSIARTAVKRDQSGLNFGAEISAHAPVLMKCDWPWCLFSATGQISSLC